MSSLPVNQPGDLAVIFEVDLLMDDRMYIASLPTGRADGITEFKVALLFCWYKMKYFGLNLILKNFLSDVAISLSV